MTISPHIEQRLQSIKKDITGKGALKRKIHCTVPLNFFSPSLYYLPLHYMQKLIIKVILTNTSINFIAYFFETSMNMHSATK